MIKKKQKRKYLAFPGKALRTIYMRKCQPQTKSAYTLSKFTLSSKCFVCNVV